MLNLFKTALAYTLGSITPHSVTLNWDKEPVPVTGFYIYRSHTGIDNWALVGGTLGPTTFTDTNVRGGLRYYYEIRAFGPTGIKSLPSAVFTTVVPLI